MHGMKPGRFDLWTVSCVLLLLLGSKRPYQLKVEYNATLGYPVSFVLHPGGTSTDENMELRITNLSPLN
jgi:hypothetical protein